MDGMLQQGEHQTAEGGGCCCGAGEEQKQQVLHHFGVAELKALLLESSG